MKNLQFLSIKNSLKNLKSNKFSKFYFTHNTNSTNGNGKNTIHPHDEHHTYNTNVLDQLRDASNSNPDKVTVLFCDIQDRYIKKIYSSESLLLNCSIMAKFSTIYKYQNIITEQAPEVFGKTCNLIKASLVQPVITGKTKFSMFSNHNVSDDRIYILIGMEAHICVFQTAMNILNKTNKLIILRDCISSTSASERNNAIENLSKSGATITTMESMFMYVLEDSNNLNFKKVLPLMKEIVANKSKELI